jgi:hypothetical protein
MVDENSQAQINPNQPAGNPEWGYRLNFAPSPTAILHDFCGENRIEGAFCPHCQKPLLRLLSLNTKDEVLNIDPAKIPAVHLLYCWTCGIPFDEFCYRMNDDGSVSLLKVLLRYPSEFGPEGPYDGYTGVFGIHQVSLDPVSSEDQQRYKASWMADDVDSCDWDCEVFHQVGGYPYLYNPERRCCPGCGMDMPFFASICDNATGNDAFAASGNDSFCDNGGVVMIFYFCRLCSVVSAYHSCD